jgi:AmmeMemoRadiSam system protein B
VATASSRPRLRPIESIVVPDTHLGRALVLRDTQGVAPTNAVVPIDLVSIVSRFDGRRTCEQIAREVGREEGRRVPVDLVVSLATELEDSLFVDGEHYRRARASVEREFRDADVRPAAHAGGAYHADPRELARYLDESCLGAPGLGAHGDGDDDGARGARALVGLVAPHIDPWRGARSYGEAYAALRADLPGDVDTVVLFGTSHAPMREPFALCRKAFATPLGNVPADLEAIDAIAEACDFDPYADQFNHKREHSLEFQAVFLRHLLGRRRLRIIPVLAGLGEQQSTGKSPSKTRSVERFFEAIREVLSSRRAVVIAGADLAHVGPRFGDAHPYDERARRRLEATDRDSLGLATSLDAEGFWAHVARDLDARRVCGLGPMYALMRSLEGPTRKGELRHYEQTVDPEEGSIVSHAAVGFYQGPKKPC